MNLKEILYLRGLREVKHTTLNPNGPGVVRIHLVPPKQGVRDGISAVILNGKDILPLKPAWTIMLAEMIDQINRFYGHELGENELRLIKDRTLAKMKSIYRKTDENVLKDDLSILVKSLLDVAYGKVPETQIPYMSIGEYAPYMNAPHRMDLMVSAMTKNGHWHCNQKCTNCYAAGQQQAEVEELSTEEWKKIIDKCREACIPQLTFTGGEPTMRKDLVELINYAQWFVTRLNTNGILLTEELCEALYKVSLDSVQITLYSSEKEEHEALTGANAFDKTVQGIKNALAAGLNVSVNTPLCKINKDYAKTLKFLHELGVEYVSCSGIIFTGNARNQDAQKQQLTEHELFRVLAEAVDFCKENQMEISFTSPGQVSKDKLDCIGLAAPTCGACLSNMAIAPNGDVVPCQSWLGCDAKLGNMLTDKWATIWESPKAYSTRVFAAKVEQTCPLRTAD